MSTSQFISFFVAVAIVTTTLFSPLIPQKQAEAQVGSLFAGFGDGAATCGAVGFATQGLDWLGDAFSGFIGEGIGDLLDGAGLGDLISNIPGLGDFAGGIPGLGGGGNSVPVNETNTDLLGNIASINAFEGTLVQKEYFWDCVLRIAAKSVINSIVASVIDWINNDFRGGPSFITDFDSFLLDVADQIAGEFIEGTAAGFLCDPFNLDVRIALTIDYYLPRTERDISCRLTDVLENYNSFVAGNFSDGGWSEWFEVAVKPQNNRYGAYLKSSGELARLASARTSEEVGQLDRNRGFLCQEDPETGNCVTPGDYIANTLDRHIHTELNELEMADEINEMLAALMGFLMRQIFEGENGGVLGLSGIDSQGSSSLDRLRNANQNIGLLQKQNLLNRIDAAIASAQAQGLTQFIPQLQTLRAQVSATAPTNTSALSQFSRDLAQIEAQIRGSALLPGEVPPPPPPPSAPAGGGTTPPTDPAGGGGTTPPPPPPPPAP
jgi:hypothetical protein